MKTIYRTFLLATLALVPLFAIGQGLDRTFNTKENLDYFQQLLDGTIPSIQDSFAKREYGLFSDNPSKLEDGVEYKTLLPIIAPRMDNVVQMPILQTEEMYDSPMPVYIPKQKGFFHFETTIFKSKYCK
ncbi:hypothetical protein ACFQ1M_06525 [Sungkyunkwania multivorans]|uniref:Uncharacterized protein n=1 Tax=Sungkyunkwania multivorans TaxID=1173618 RepID=A0ABW3CXK5_9FLAO